MSLVKQEPYKVVPWYDAELDKRGWLVIHTLGPTGLCTGGTRMRAGCTESEVRELALGMALKTAVYGLPVGGAKAGIDCDPKDSAAKEALKRFMAFVHDYLDKHWVTAEDLGVSQQQIDDVFAELGLGQSYHAAIMRSDNVEVTMERVRAGLNAPVDGGYLLGDVVGGYGVAQACLAWARAMGRDVTETTVAVQGIGTMGGAAAWYLHEADMKVVQVSDAVSSLWRTDGAGLDIPELLKLRNEYNEIPHEAREELRKNPSMEVTDRTAVLSAEVDILIPAAQSQVITAVNVDQVMAKVIVEAANAPISDDAQRVLANKGIGVIPDFVANAGAVAWAWWLLFGKVDDNPEATFDMLGREINPKVESLVQEWYATRRRDTTIRDLAIDLATELAKQSNDQTVTIP